MSKKDLLKIFGVVMAAEYVAHKKCKKNGLIHRVLRQMDDRGLLNENTARDQRLRSDLERLNNA